LELAEKRRYSQQQEPHTNIHLVPLFSLGVKSMRKLSDLEAELLELLRCGAMTVKEIEEIDPKFVGALGNLKCMGLVIIERLPNKERKIFAKNPY